MHKVYNKVPQSYLPPRQTRLTRGAHNHSLRQMSRNTEGYKYSFFPRTTIEWNRLPYSAVTVPIVEHFKAAIATN